MLCEELEQMEAQFSEIITALENPNLTQEEKEFLQAAYVRLSRIIQKHQKSGHDGGPCFEE